MEHVKKFFSNEWVMYTIFVLILSGIFFIPDFEEKVIGIFLGFLAIFLIVYHLFFNKEKHNQNNP